MTVPLPAAPPRRLKELAPVQVEALLQADPRLLVPVGTAWAPAPDLPFGAATVVVERLADDLSAAFGVLRAPTVEYGVNPPRRDAPAGTVTLRRKTLHRVLNDLVASWEGCGVQEFVLLTAHRYDPHQEALATVIPVTARVRVVDVLGVDLRDLLPFDLLDQLPAGRGRDAGGPRPDGPLAQAWAADALRAVLRHLAPELVRRVPPAEATGPTDPRRPGRRVGDPLPPPPESPAAQAARGARIYARLYARIAERVMGRQAAAPEVGG